MTYRDYARVLLGLIRLINGAIALFVPQIIIGRFDKAGTEAPVTRYALRMFGVRTILIALDLFGAAGTTRSHAVRVAPIVHISDTAAAFLAARSGKIAASSGVMIVVISAVNTALSLLMQGGGENDSAAPEA